MWIPLRPAVEPRCGRCSLQEQCTQQRKLATIRPWRGPWRLRNGLAKLSHLLQRLLWMSKTMVAKACVIDEPGSGSASSVSVTQVAWTLLPRWWQWAQRTYMNLTMARKVAVSWRKIEKPCQEQVQQCSLDDWLPECSDLRQTEERRDGKNECQDNFVPVNSVEHSSLGHDRLNIIAWNVNSSTTRHTEISSSGPSPDGLASRNTELEI